MNRNEFLDALPLTRIVLRLTSASLEICTDAIDDVHVMASGADGDVKALSIAVRGEQLIVEQPAKTLARNPVASSWLQITIRVPQSWKGQLEARTVSGWISVRGLYGTDLSLDSVSGLITASALQFHTMSLRTVTGDIRAGGLMCFSLTLGSTSGSISLQESNFTRCSVSSITAPVTLSLCAPFQAISGSSVLGDLIVDAPIDRCNASIRSVSGRISASGVFIDEEAASSIQFNTVSGNLDLTRLDTEA